MALTKTLTLVSGLPRSGTSLMMQLLEAGGLPAWTDGVRLADEDNPGGYFEWQPMLEIGKRPDLLDAEGVERHAIKCVSALLPQLPKHHRYRVLFLMRPLTEIARSQAIMLERRGMAGMEGTIEEVAAALAGHRQQVFDFLQQDPVRFEVLKVEYPRLVQVPGLVLRQVVEFLGEDLLPRAGEMVRVVKPELYRNRLPERP